jgi:hypothetical protein
MRRLFLVLALSLLALPSFAQKRRAVSAPAFPEATLTADLVDSVTNKPVIMAEVSGSGIFARSNRLGQITVKVPVGPAVDLTITRTGYETKTEKVSFNGDTKRTFTLKAKPTVKATNKDGVQYELDADSVEFGYAEFFLGYRRDSKAKMCKPGGGEFTLERDKVKRLHGPAFTDADLNCCANGTPAGIEVQLASGETTRAYFVDSCGHSEEVIGRDHATWDLVYLKVVDLVDVVFP